MSVAARPRAAQGLRRYVASVAAELAIGPDVCSVEATQRPMNAYLALAQRIPRHPDRDVALVWDQGHGWAVVLETTPREWPSSWEDLIPLSYLGGDLLPAPSVVVGFVTALLADHYPGRPDPPDFPCISRAELAQRLAAYPTGTGPHRS